MSNQPSSNVVTIISLVLVPVLALGTYIGQVPLTVFEGLLTALLGYFGIVAARQLAKIKALDLTTFISDKALIGIDGLFSCGFLFVENVMPQANFLAFLFMILGAFGIIAASAKVAR